KKTLLALLVAGVATSAQAKVELFKDDASSVSVKGEIATFLYTSDYDHKTDNTKDVKTDLDVNAWAKVQFDFSHKVT
nr:porin [Vibrio anguillarum]